MREETGLGVEIVRKIGEYHESGVNNGIEYDYYPTCFLVKVVEGKISRQKEEIEQMRLFDFDKIPEKLAFKHSDMIITQLLPDARSYSCSCLFLAS